MEASTGKGTQIQRDLAIAASPETVWEFLVDSELAMRWMGTMASLDARAGGEYRVEVLPGRVAAGEFVEVDRPRRLVWTWGWAEGDSAVAPGSGTIEVVLEPEGDGTVLRFSHKVLPDEDAVARHARGWEHYLGRLETAARGDDPGRDPSLDGMT
jgi:uncharacterized protein YndB with AHSA1/START domain